MENASKALIIAGAILLAILLISLGIMIYNQASGVVDSNAMDEVAVNSFNQKFQQYEGDNVRGTQVNALLNTVLQNNLSNAGDESKQISISVTATQWGDNTKPSGKITTAPTKALTGKSYKVTCEADTKSGYITKITIANS